MNAKLTTTAAVVASALLLPLAGYSADMYKSKDNDASSRSSPKEFVKDSAITAKIKAEMAKDKQVSAMHIKVDTDNQGVVQLTGTAKSKDEADKAVSIARSVKGVTSVENNIQVARDR